jgi:hypothetical protein
MDSEPISEAQLKYEAQIAGERTQGVSQGSPISPLLSLLVLKKAIFDKFPDQKVVMYADDGVVFGDMHSLTEDQQWLMFG